MDFFTSIFEFLTLAGGPFCVFAGMGKDKNVGKLTFRNIITADSSMEITENSQCVTLKSNNAAVPANKVPWGTTSSIAWGFLEVDTTSQALTGAYIIANSSNSVIGTTVSSLNNLIINPKDNTICGPYAVDSVIVSSKSSEMKDTSRRNTIIGGSKSKMYSLTDQSSIIGSCDSCTDYAIVSSILSSYKTILDNTCFSSIISSRKSSISRIPSGSQIRGSTLISSYQSKIYGVDFSSILSSRTSYIKNYNALVCSRSNSIISSCQSRITGGQINDGTTAGSNRSSILASLSSYIKDACDSTIISGYKNSICVDTFNGGNMTKSKNYGNTIISGTCNKIFQNNSFDYSGDICFNSIVSSKCSSIYRSCCTSILTSDCGTSIYDSRNSVIMGGSKSVTLTSGINSTIIASPMSQASGSQVVVLAGYFNVIVSGLNSGSVAGSGNVISSGSYCGVIIGGCLNQMKGSQDSVIASGQKNYSKNSCASSILGGICNCIDAGKNGAILGGELNLVSATLTNFGGGVVMAGCKNQVNSGYSVVVGGKQNIIDDGLGNSLYSAIIGGEQNNITQAHSVVIGSCNLSGTGNYTTTVTNLIFDKHVFISSTYCGSTVAINLPASFKIRKGFITTT